MRYDGRYFRLYYICFLFRLLDVLIVGGCLSVHFRIGFHLQLQMGKKDNKDNCLFRNKIVEFEIFVLLCYFIYLEQLSMASLRKKSSILRRPYGIFTTCYSQAKLVFDKLKKKPGRRLLMIFFKLVTIKIQSFQKH